MTMNYCRDCGQEHFDCQELAHWCRGCFVHFEKFERLVMCEWETTQCIDDPEVLAGLVQFASIYMMGLAIKSLDACDVADLERWLVPLVLHQWRRYVSWNGENYQQLQLLTPLPLAVVNVTISEGARTLRWCR